MRGQVSGQKLLGIRRLLGVLTLYSAGLGKVGVFLFGRLGGRSIRQIDFWSQDANIRQMTILFLVIQAIPHNKMIR